MDKEPIFDNLLLHEFSILTGEDIRVILKFDTEELPVELPIKWKVEKVNTIQFTLEFIDVDLKQVNINSKNFRNCQLIYEPSGGNRKKLKCIDILGRQVFVLDVKWIYLKNLSGYQNNKTSK